MNFLRRKRKYEKISFNCPQEVIDKLNYMVEYSPTFENRTEVLVKAISNEYNKFIKKVERLEKLNKT